jgi:cellulose biosynthesis protein BcsQ
MSSHLIPHAVLVGNSKGGVGKTSVTAHLAGYAAAAGWRVLAVDLDAQGNLSRDLGYREETDNGKSLADAIAIKDPSQIKAISVRPGLDVIAGGAELARAEIALGAERLTDPNAVRTLGEVIATLAAEYQLVVFDTPPATTAALVDAAFACAGNLVIPTKIDEASIDGLEGTAERFALARERHNPMIRPLGVVLFAVGTQDTRMVANARSVLSELLGEVVPVLEPTIRASRKAPVDMRAQGLLAPEYEAEAAGAEPWFEAMKRGETARTFSQSASGLAADYQAVVTELLARFSEPAAA